MVGHVDPRQTRRHPKFRMCYCVVSFLAFQFVPECGFACASLQQCEAPSKHLLVHGLSVSLNCSFLETCRQNSWWHIQCLQKRARLRLWGMQFALAVRCHACHIVMPHSDCLQSLARCEKALLLCTSWLSVDSCLGLGVQYKHLLHFRRFKSMASFAVRLSHLFRDYNWRIRSADLWKVADNSRLCRTCMWSHGQLFLLSYIFLYTLVPGFSKYLRRSSHRTWWHPWLR